MDAASLDRSIETLKARKDEWARLPISRKRDYLRGIVAAHAAVAGRLVAAAVKAKGIPAGPMQAEDWASGPYCVVRYANLLQQTLEQIEMHGSPVIGRSSIRVRPNGQLAVRVFPATSEDRLLFRGFGAEVWMREGVTPGNLAENMACFYRQKMPSGKVALVLGAGNVSSIGSLDVLTKLYLEGQVCLLKLNPVNDYLRPFVEESFAEPIRDGYIRVACGGADAGEYLCGHPDIDEIHITGSHLTHDAIVYGSGEQGRERKRNGTPRIKKRITSELGNVSPIIVVPGRWSASDLKFQAENIATQMINNCGFNCCAAKVLVLPKEWPAGGALMDQVRKVLSGIPRRNAYYPGAAERYERFVSANRTAQPIGPRHGDELPWTLIPDLDSEDSNICFTTESFCAVMAQTSLEGADPASFLRHAIRFCNEKLWGTLSACVIVDPETQQTLGSGFEDAVGDLRYGTVGINHWPVLSFAWGVTTWGAFPGHTYEDIQSGIGIVHNALMFDQPERTVVHGPFRVWPRPAWLVTNRRAADIFPAITRMEARPGIVNLLRVVLASLGG